MIHKDKKWLIVGCGLIGGSIAKALFDYESYVSGIALKQEEIDFAIENKILVDGANASDEEKCKNLVKNADYILIGLYPSMVGSWVKKYAHGLKENAILFDVTGIKSEIVAQVNESLDGVNAEFLPLHPMAGKEVSGVQNADKMIFRDANFIIISDNNNSEHAIETANDLASLLGTTKVSLLSAKEHDSIIAYVSQLPHLMACALMNCDTYDGLNSFIGDSFRDLTRIANINANLWEELFFKNKESLLPEIKSFVEEMQKLSTAIEKEDSKSLVKLLEQATARRKAMAKN